MRAVPSIKVLSGVFALLLLPALLIQCYTSFIQAGFFLSHDEAEHLHVVFALARGERPYVDFLENHPVLFHLILLWMAKVLGLTQVMSVYFLGKTLVFIHYFGCLTLVALALRHFSGYLKVKSHFAALIVIALSMSGIWSESSRWPVGHDSLWHFRPDWLCQFYAICCIYLHFAYHWRLLRGGAGLSLWVIALAALSGGVATAILAKSILVFLPYALLVGSIAFTERGVAFAWWRDYRKQLIVANGLFLFVGVLTFVLLVWIELMASQVHVMEYYKANFVLNSVKHDVFNMAGDFSPVNVLRSLLGLGLLPTLALGMWVMSQLALAQRNSDYVLYHLWYFLFLVVVINMVLPAFSNGATWVQYFLPSVLALVLVLALVVDTIFTQLTRLAVISFDKGGGRGGFMLGKHLRWGVPVLMAIAVFCKSEDAWQRLKAQVDVDQLYKTDVGDGTRDFLPDRLLPEDLSYLVFGPVRKPVKARAWGYFFMLGPDRNVWREAHDLGFAPDPKSHWRSLYATQPPDVIVLSSKDDFVFKTVMLRAAQRVDIAWLWAKMQDDYTCLTRKKVRVYVRNELLPRFQSEGWKRAGKLPAIFDDTE